MKNRRYNVLLGLGMFVWFLITTSLFVAVVGTLAWVVVIYGLNRFQRPKTITSDPVAETDEEVSDESEEDIDEEVILAWLRRNNINLDDDAELNDLLEDIGENRSRWIEVIMEAVMNGEEIDSEKEEEIIVGLIAEEFLPDAYSRRAAIGELSKTAPDPVSLWKTYKEQETEDLDEFIDEIETEIAKYREHSVLVKKGIKSPGTSS